ncbi:hypothetical protein Aph01nite_18540 [Acrocarpospora phusangensis]|uniref:Uncharacterized protein n=1 Tax=Acrocarpospora phusangensis TaxID=1070424 RepID=A0A919Q997_9ACTN|nr:hypothetical protein Aph01nite_18540 [Acrocarpospora phusangensis]
MRCLYRQVRTWVQRVGCAPLCKVSFGFPEVSVASLPTEPASAAWVSDIGVLDPGTVKRGTLRDYVCRLVPATPEALH